MEIEVENKSGRTRGEACGESVGEMAKRRRLIREIKLRISNILINL